MSNASAREFSHHSATSEILPPINVGSEAPIVLKIERDRTVKPRTTPKCIDTLNTFRLKVVEVIGHLKSD